MSASSSSLVGQTIAVVGLGRSGLSAATVARQAGARVLATDSRARSAFGGEELECLEASGVELELGGHAGVDWGSVTTCVVSPGVPPLPLLNDLQGRGVEVISELEFGLRFVEGPVVTVGGTNGKSTTTTLLAKMLQQAGQNVFCGGNLGTPVSDAAGRSWDVLVVEVSSFQLERSPSIKPKVSLLLNVSEDHLDRYDSFDDYANAKGNAFVNQSSDDVAIVPAGDAVCLAQASRGAGRVVTFGSGGDYFLRDDTAVERHTGMTLPLSDISLYGTHNRHNLLAAFAAASSLGATPEAIVGAARAFVPLPHRMQRVAVKGGVAYYDDSKATNVGAAVTAISGLTEARCVVVAGGRDKHGSYEPLVAALRHKARAVVLIGEAAERMADAIGDAVSVHRAATMGEAVRAAARLAEPTDAVLLSPACSSFDMFDSYAHRGDEFARAVNSLGE